MKIIPEIKMESGALIEGENVEIMNTLAEIGYRHAFKMIYFDGPFNSGLLFTLYNSTHQFDFISPWSQYNTIHNYVQPERYLEHYRERIKLAKDLLREDGIFVLQTNQLFGHHVKVLLDDIFGRENMLPEVIWKHSMEPWNVIPGYSVGYQHETLYFYSKSDKCDRIPPSSSLLPSVWEDIPGYGDANEEEVLYPSQKPERLIDRIIDITTREGDLVGDFYCGSGTFPYVAEKKGRRWVSCDNNTNAIQMTKQRVSSINPFLQVHHTQDEFIESFFNNNVYTKTVQTPFSELELEGILACSTADQIEVNAYSYSPSIDLSKGNGRITFNLIFPEVTEEGFNETETVKMPRPYLVAGYSGIRLMVPEPIEWVFHHLVLVERNGLNQINMGKYDKDYRHIFRGRKALQEAEEIVAKINGNWIAKQEDIDGFIIITDLFGYQYKHQRQY